MYVSWIIAGFPRPAQSAHENLSALIASDALSGWLKPGGLRDSWWPRKLQ